MRDSVDIVCPLFQIDNVNMIPTTAKQLTFSKINIRQALELNEKWHSRLPDLTNWHGCISFAAHYENVIYAVAIWGNPIARAYNGLGYIELRRMAICDNAPKNTASRMIGWMLKILRNDGYIKAISYQDTSVHLGTIYKASNWHIGGMKKNIGTGWNTRPRNIMQTMSDKIRWEYDLCIKCREER